jgi:acid stress-induced BolA-like protein IbaG/YrbA
MAAVRTLREDVAEILQERFPESEPHLEYSPHSGKVTGTILWSGFAGLRHIDRQRLVWETLERRLSVSEQRKVSAILTLTPDEWTSLREDE